MEERIRERFIVAEDLVKCGPHSSIRRLGGSWNVDGLERTIGDLVPNTFEPSTVYVMLPLDGVLIQSEDGTVTLDREALVYEAENFLRIAQLAASSD